MTMTAASTSGWNPTLSSAAFGQQYCQPPPPPPQHSATNSSICLCQACNPCSCLYCMQQRSTQQLSPSFPEQHQHQTSLHHSLPASRLPTWAPAQCFTLPRSSPFGMVPNPITGDHGSSDEALSPPHQDDPLDDIMDVKEASRLQQEIVKSWKQKKRVSCEMKTRTQDKYRQVYNSQQRFELEKEYHYQKYITTARKSELSSTLHLSERQIKIWFQNRRAKERRQKKNVGKASRREQSSPDADAFVKEVEVKQEES